MATKELDNIIKKAGERLLADMKAVTPKVSGKTAESLELKLTAKGFEILGGKQIGALINGRKPTSKNAKKGDPTLQQQILEWIKAASITPRESGMTQEALSWAISQSIHKKGFKGRGNFYAPITTDKRINEIAGKILNQKLTDAFNQVNKINSEK